MEGWAMAKTILIIEDDNEINSMLRTLLRTNGFQTISAFSGTEGVLHVSRVYIDGFRIWSCWTLCCPGAAVRR